MFPIKYRHTWKPTRPTMRANSNESKMKLDEICGLFALLTTLVFLQFGLQESLAKKMGRPGKGRSKSHSSRIILLDNRRKEAFNHSDVRSLRSQTFDGCNSESMLDLKKTGRHDRQSVALWLRVFVGTQDQVLVCGTGKSSSDDHLVQGRRRTAITRVCLH